MAERSEAIDEEAADESSTAAYLLASAVHLKQTAARAGRPDVAAKADEILALLADRDEPTGDQDERRERSDVGDAVLKVLNGLGF